MVRKKVRNYFNLPSDAFIITYAPTFRDNARTKGEFSMSPYNLDTSLLKAFKTLFKADDCHLVIKLHPYIAKFSNNLCHNDVHVHDGTQYEDMQELIIGSDALISDYSSCIFDAALFRIPCFIYANDFDDYKKDRGVYFELEELPFPFGRDNDELRDIIFHFNYDDYLNKLEKFEKKVGLYEPGNASEKIAKYICSFINGNYIVKQQGE